MLRIAQTDLDIYRSPACARPIAQQAVLDVPLRQEQWGKAEHSRWTAEEPTGTTSTPSMWEEAQLYRRRDIFAELRDPRVLQLSKTQPFIALDCGGWIISTSWECWLGDVVLLVGLNCESVMHGKPNQHSAMHKQKTDLREYWSVFYAFVLHILSIYFWRSFCLSLTELYWWGGICVWGCFPQGVPSGTLNHRGTTAYLRSWDQVIVEQKIQNSCGLVGDGSSPQKQESKNWAHWI